MCRRAGLVLIALLFGIGLDVAPGHAQTLIDDRIVRVVYAVRFERSGLKDATWGFHLANMSDGRYCVRFGNPGRLALANIRRGNDMCFDSIPGRAERASERVSPSGETDVQGQPRDVTTFIRGGIELAGTELSLDIEYCVGVAGDLKTRCFPVRYMVRMLGETCIADVPVPPPHSRVKAIMCEHYKAE
jgi:hypothetical protein